MLSVVGIDARVEAVLSVFAAGSLGAVGKGVVGAVHDGVLAEHGSHCRKLLQIDVSVDGDVLGVGGGGWNRGDDDAFACLVVVERAWRLAGARVQVAALAVGCDWLTPHLWAPHMEASATEDNAL